MNKDHTAREYLAVFASVQHWMDMLSIFFPYFQVLDDFSCNVFKNGKGRGRFCLKAIKEGRISFYFTELSGISKNIQVLKIMKWWQNKSEF